MSLSIAKNDRFGEAGKNGIAGDRIAPLAADYHDNRSGPEISRQGERPVSAVRGCPDLLHFLEEWPQHRVRITKPFYLGTYHVTRGQFRQFVKDTGYKTDAEKGEFPGAAGWNPDKEEFGFNEKYS